MPNVPFSDGRVAGVEKAVSLCGVKSVELKSNFVFDGVAEGLMLFNVSPSLENNPPEPIGGYKLPIPSVGRDFKVDASVSKNGILLYLLICVISLGMEYIAIIYIVVGLIIIGKDFKI